MKVVPREEKGDEVRTDWGSIWITSGICLFTAIQFTIYFSSLWPYLQQLDSSSTESEFGYITAIYSFGQALASPLFGYWSNRLGSTKIPIMSGLTMMIVGNIIYFLIPLFDFSVKNVMMVSRIIMGLGGGVVTVLRTYAIQGSVMKDRSRAISLNTGGFSLGLVLGPAIQIIFTPLQYPGIHLGGALYFNMYNAPAVMGIVVNVASLALMMFCFKESNVGVHVQEKAENEDHDRFFVMPKYDILAVMLCIYTRFAQMFVITNVETIGSPLSMIMFNWDRHTAVFWNSVMHAGFGFLGLVIYGANTIWNFGHRMNHRVWTMIGMLLLVIFHLTTFPWWGMTEKIHYQEEFLIVNGSQVANPEPTGCRRSFEWCDHVPAIDVYVYFISYIVLIGASFPIVNVTMNTVYSTVIGPRNQGTMQGVLMLSGSVARMIGPLFVAVLFEKYGPRIPWVIEIVLAGSCVIGWIVLYRRMIPLKLANQLRAGESIKNKYGTVIKF